MKKIALFLITALALSSCQQQPPQPLQQQAAVQYSPPPVQSSPPPQQDQYQAAPAVQVQNQGQTSMDLTALADLATNSASASDLEGKINNSGINQMDLTGDGTTNYLDVSEYMTSQYDRGYYVYGYGNTGSKIPVATIRFVQNTAGQSTCIVTGAPQWYGYGNQATYRNNILPSAFACAYMWHRHNLYVSPWGYNRYPTAYHRTKIIRTTVYVNNSHQPSNAQSNSVGAAQQQKTYTKPQPVASAATSRDITNASVSQKKFVDRDPNKAVDNSGFKSSKPVNSSQPTVKKSSGGGYRKKK